MTDGRDRRARSADVTSRRDKRFTMIHGDPVQGDSAAALISTGAPLRLLLTSLAGTKHNTNAPPINKLTDNPSTPAPVEPVAVWINPIT